MMNSDLLKVFELNIQNCILDFCKKINTSSADLYILMARKAACFVNALEQFSFVSIGSRVISERVLDCEFDWDSIKSVIIIDDVIISGTTLNQTIKDIKCKNPRIKIKVIVIGINARWFNQSLLDDENGKSYIEYPVKTLSNTECIRLSGDIVKMLSLVPLPYNIDYPIYNTLRLNDFTFSQMLDLPGWEIAESSSLVQDNQNIFTYTFIPCNGILGNNGNLFNNPLIHESLLKVRVYGCTTIGKKKGVHAVTIVPMAILPPLKFSKVEELFEALSGTYSKTLSSSLATITSKLRFIQYAIADLLAKVFIQELDYFTNKETTIVRKNETMRLLFPEVIIPEIIAAADMNLFNIDFEYLSIQNIPKKFDSPYSQNDFVGINDTLKAPFIDMYYRGEIPARRLALEYGFKIFDMPEYMSIINRLKYGYSLMDLENLLSNYSLGLKKRLVSAFLDKAVDNGIAVPITVVEKDIIYRAFRHGEDVQFGQREERLCMEMFNAFNDEITKKTWQKLWVEKLIVLFLKIGEATFLDPIQTDVSGYSSIASVRYYLQGPVAVINSGDSFSDNPCLEYADKAKWLTRDLLFSENFPLSLNNEGLYIFNENLFNERNYTNHDHEIIIEPNLIKHATEIGEVMGKLLNNSILKQEPSLSTDDLISLSCCMTPKDIIGALAAEINIVIRTFQNGIPSKAAPIEQLYKELEKSTQINSTKIKSLRNGPFFQAINDGIRKFGWFKDGHPYAVIERVKSKYKKRRDIVQWESLWSPNAGWGAPNETSAKILNFIDLEGQWLLCVKVYVLILEYHFHFKNNDSHSMSKIFSQIEDVEKKLFPYVSKSKILRLIMPFISEFKKQRDNLNYNQTIFEVTIQKLDILIKRAYSIVEDANEYFKSFNKRPKIQYFQTALYICIENNLFEKDIMNTFVSIVFRMTNGTVPVKASLKYMPQNDVSSNNSDGMWFAGVGSGAGSWLLQFAAEIMCRLNERTNYKILYFPALPDSCKIKLVDNTRKFSYNNFKLVIDQLQDFIMSIPFQKNVIFEIKETSVKSTIQEENSKYRDAVITEKKDIKLYTPNTSKFYTTKYYINMNDKIKKQSNIGILTIVTEEAQAVLKSFSNVRTIQHSNRYFDEFDYKTTHGNSIKGVHLQSADQGNTSIINAFNSLTTHYSCDYIILLGIAGSLKNSINLGDVYIGTSVLNYEKRKENPNGEIEHRGTIFNNSFALSQHLNRFFVLHSEPATFVRNSVEGRNSNFKVHRGPIGSGEAVIGNPQSPTRAWLQSVNGKIGIVETEAAGFFQAYYESEKELTTLEGNISDIIVIRGISDHADQHKNDDYRLEASLNAVHALKELIEILFSADI